MNYPCNTTDSCALDIEVGICLQTGAVLDVVITSRRSRETAGVAVGQTNCTAGIRQQNAVGSRWRREAESRDIGAVGRLQLSGALGLEGVRYGREFQTGIHFSVPRRRTGTRTA